MLVYMKAPSSPEAEMVPLSSHTVDRKWEVPLGCYFAPLHFPNFAAPFAPRHTRRFVTQVSLLPEKMQRSVPSNYCRHYDVLKAIPCAWLITVDSKGHLLLN